MKLRIFAFMSLVIILFVCLLSSAWGITLGSRFHTQIKNGLKTLRVSITDENGYTLFNNSPDFQPPDNSTDIASALENGYAESEYYSKERGEKTYYFTQRQNDNTILHLALTTSNGHAFIYSFVALAAASLLLVLAATLTAAKWITKRIVTSIDNSSPDSYVFDELSPFIKSIEQQKQEITKQLSELESRTTTIETITGSMKEGLILVDAGGSVLSANTTVQNILNVNDMSGKKMLHICRDMNISRCLKQCLAGKYAETLFHINNSAYNVYFSPVFSAGKSGGAIILFLDVTERQKTEKQRREFSANVSHELKTPLTTIAALSEMICNGMAKEQDVKRFAENISEQSKRLINMIEDIIRLSEFDEANNDKNYTSFDLYELAAATTEGLQEKADSKRVTLQVVGENTQITANKRMIDELLYNLIDNGITYNVEGGRVTVSLSAADDLCVISVADTGVGIPAEHHERVFERFYRVDKSRSRRTGGTGLGLSIVKHTVEYHDGSIELTSDENTGTTITCYIKQ